MSSISVDDLFEACPEAQYITKDSWGVTTLWLGKPHQVGAHWCGACPRGSLFHSVTVTGIANGMSIKRPTPKVLFKDLPTGAQFELGSVKYTKVAGFTGDPNTVDRAWHLHHINEVALVTPIEEPTDG